MEHSHAHSFTYCQWPHLHRSGKAVVAESMWNKNKQTKIYWPLRITECRAELVEFSGLITEKILQDRTVKNKVGKKIQVICLRISP